MSAIARSAITVGEPAGIGPELVRAARGAPRASGRSPARLVVRRRPRAARASARARIGARRRATSHYDPRAVRAAGRRRRGLAPAARRARSRPGSPIPTNAHSVLAMLAHAADACATGAFAALVTAPVQKSVLHGRRHSRSPDTPSSSPQRTHTPRVVMLLVGGAPMRRCASRSSPRTCRCSGARRRSRRRGRRRNARDRRRRAHRELRHRGAAHRRMRPQPACRRGRPSGPRGDRRHRARRSPPHARRGIDVDRPDPRRHRVRAGPSRAQYDAIVAMYHDQGLPVLKAASFGHGVNVTLGLPFIRTSVDHGTALDLARDADRARDAPTRAACSPRSTSRSSSPAAQTLSDHSMSAHATHQGHQSRASASARTSSPTRTTSSASSPRSRRGRATTSSRSARASPR